MRRRDMFGAIAAAAAIAATARVASAEAIGIDEFKRRVLAVTGEMMPWARVTFTTETVDVLRGVNPRRSQLKELWVAHIWMTPADEVRLAHVAGDPYATRSGRPFEDFIKDRLRDDVDAPHRLSVERQRRARAERENARLRAELETLIASRDFRTAVVPFRGELVPVDTRLRVPNRPTVKV